MNTKRMQQTRPQKRLLMLKKGSALFLAGLLLLSLCGCRSFGKKRDNTVAVITKGTDSNFWRTVRSGVNAAATEYNIRATFEGPGSEEDFAAQNKLIEEAVSRGVAVIVLSAIDYEKTASAVEKAVAAGVRVILIDSDVNVDGKELFIGTNNYAAGEEAGQALLTLCKEADAIRVGIVNYGRGTENSQQREKGLRTFLEEQSNTEVVKTIYIDSNERSATKGAEALLTEHPEINVLVGLNEWSTLGVGRAIQNLGLKDRVCGVGFDSNVDCVSMLENGDLDTLIVQNPFSIGYTAIENAAKLLEGEKVKEDIEIATYRVDRSNMFSPDIQKILVNFD